MSPALLWAAILLGCGADRPPPPAPAADPTEAWGAQLAQVVSVDGHVDLAALRADPAPLDAFVGWVAVHGPESDGWRLTDDDRRLAWHLNTINAHVLWAARAAPDEADRPGRSSASVRVHADGEILPLDRYVSHRVMATYEEPTAIAGIYCFAEGCPPMRARLYEKKGLDAALGAQMKRWVQAGLVRDEAGAWVYRSALRPWLSSFERWRSASTPCAITAPFAEPALAERLSADTACPHRWEP